VDYRGKEEKESRKTVLFAILRKRKPFVEERCMLYITGSKEPFKVHTPKPESNQNPKIIVASPSSIAIEDNTTKRKIPKYVYGPYPPTHRDGQNDGKTIEKPKKVCNTPPKEM
jgi:hypothetical protein